MKDERLKSITTAALYSKGKKKRGKEILTTKNLPDLLPFQKGDEESSLKTAITTTSKKEKEKNEKKR